ncbi:MAG TPA: class II aldolase/adducin family protein [Candidatus Methylomirabilis sp.]|jgi:L-fuculose-phosphate aldolase
MAQTPARRRAAAAGEQNLRRDVALGCRVLALQGLAEGMLGIVGHRRPGAETFWIKPSDLPLDEVTAESLLLYNLDGKLLRGDRPPHSEIPLYTVIYRLRPEVASIVHLHSPYAAAFCTRGEGLAQLNQYTAFFQNDLSIFRESPERVNTAALGRAIAERLGGAKALLIQHHGMVAVGADMPTAVGTAIFLERAIRSQALAGQFGPPVSLDAHWTKRLAESTPYARLIGHEWAACLRRLARKR